MLFRSAIPPLHSGTLLPAAERDGWLTAHPDGDALVVETPHYLLALNPDGSFASLYDRELHREWVKKGAGFNRLRLWADYPGMYDAWDILPNYQDVEVEKRLETPVRMTRCEASFAEFRADFATDKSRWSMIIRLFPDSRGIEVEHAVDWHEKHVLAKVNFGPDVLSREMVCDTSAGFIRRSLTKNTSWEQARFEVCHHKWFDISETGAGLAVINTGKYGVGLEGDEVSLSLLRSTIRPDITSDMGEHHLRYLILPHAGDAVAAEVNRRAFEYNIPLTSADVSLPEPWRQVLADSDLWLQSLKLSEDGARLILRLSEQDGRRLTLPLPAKVQLMNLLEDPEEEISCLRVHPFEILTLGIPLMKE